jgi:hypothetical protein
MGLVCKYCSSRIYLSAMSQRPCEECGTPAITPHIPAYKLCDKCAVKHFQCQQCRKDMKQEESK